MPPGAKLAVALPLGGDVLALFPPLWSVVQAIEYPVTRDLCIRAVRTAAKEEILELDMDAFKAAVEPHIVAAVKRGRR